MFCGDGNISLHLSPLYLPLFPPSLLPLLQAKKKGRRKRRVILEREKAEQKARAVCVACVCAMCVRVLWSCDMSWAEQKARAVSGMRHRHSLSYPRVNSHLISVCCGHAMSSVYSCVYVGTCMWTRVYVCMYVCMYMCVYVCVNVCVCMCVCMYVYGVRERGEPRGTWTG